jgi:hypothetical protein
MKTPPEAPQHRIDSPRVCPHPNPQPVGPGPDCALAEAAARIRFQRLVELEADSWPSLGQLVYADLNKSFRRPATPPTRPAPTPAEPVTLPPGVFQALPPDQSTWSAARSSTAETGANHA